jgi:hypothetical protein
MMHELPPLDRIRIQYGILGTEKLGWKERTPAATTSESTQYYNVTRTSVAYRSNHRFIVPRLNKVTYNKYLKQHCLNWIK